MDVEKLLIDLIFELQMVFHLKIISHAFLDNSSTISVTIIVIIIPSRTIQVG